MLKDKKNLISDIEEKCEKIKEDILAKKIPGKLPKYLVDGTAEDLIRLRMGFDDYFKVTTMSYKLREFCHNHMGFAYISHAWIKPLAKWINDRKVLEVMAGKGAISYALRQEGIDVITTDDYSWHSKGRWENTATWTDVEKIDAIEAVKKYGKMVDIVIMAWPPMDDTALRVVKELYKVNPVALCVYIGEGMTGCTANDKFFENIDCIEDNAFDKALDGYQSFMGVHDRPSIVRYKQ